MKKKSSQNMPHPHIPFAAVFMVIIVALLTVALLLVWRELPSMSRDASRAPRDIKPVPVAPASPEQTACEAAKGKWVECGSPCHGRPGDVCIAKCEAQCLCGGISGWSCPESQVCTDYEPGPNVPNALGVCRLRSDEKPWAHLDIGFDKDLSNELLTSPFEVTGWVAAPNALAKWQLDDANGVSLESGMVHSDDEGKFTLRSFILTVPTTSTGTLEIGDSKIPVRLPTATMNVRVYKSAMDPKDCSVVFPVEMEVPRSNLPVETSLRALLTDAVGISKETRLISLKVSGGTATAVFSPELEPGGGSCEVQLIRAQIEATLKQFSSVKNVVISVVGKTPEETLQP